MRIREFKQKLEEKETIIVELQKIINDEKNSRTCGCCRKIYKSIECYEYHRRQTHRF